MKANKSLAAVILAGGRGTRIGGSEYKQFMKIHGVPVLFYSLPAFVRCSFLDTIVVVVPEEKLTYARNLIRKHFKDTRIELIVGGVARRQSSYRALEYLRSGATKIDLVVFHDAARPLVSEEMIRAVVDAGMKSGAATTAIRAIDTVGFGARGSLVSIPSKENLYYVYLPNCFRLDWLWEAHQHANNKAAAFKDAENTMLMTNIGKKIKIVDGFYPNMKLTYESDLRSMQALLQ